MEQKTESEASRMSGGDDRQGNKAEMAERVGGVVLGRERDLVTAVLLRVTLELRLI